MVMASSLKNFLVFALAISSSLVVRVHGITEGQDCGGLPAGTGNTYLRCSTQGEGSCSNSNFTRISTSFSNTTVANIDLVKDGEIYTITWGIGLTGTAELSLLTGFLVAALGGNYLNAEMYGLQTCQHLSLNKSTLLRQDIPRIGFKYSVNCTEVREAYPGAGDFYILIRPLPESEVEHVRDYRRKIDCLVAPTPPPPEDEFSLNLLVANFSVELSMELPWDIDLSVQSAVFVLAYRSNAGNYPEMDRVVFNRSMGLESPLHYTFSRLVPKPEKSLSGKVFNYFIRKYFFDGRGNSVTERNYSDTFTIKGESYSRLVNESNVSVMYIEPSGRLDITFPIAPESFLLQPSYKIRIRDHDQRYLFNTTATVPQSPTEWLNQRVPINLNKDLFERNKKYYLEIIPMGNLKCQIPDQCIPTGTLKCAPCQSVLKEFTVVIHPVPTKPPKIAAIMGGATGSALVIAIIMVLLYKICRTPDPKPIIEFVEPDNSSTQFARLLSQAYRMDVIHLMEIEGSEKPVVKYKVLCLFPKVIALLTNGDILRSDQDQQITKHFEDQNILLVSFVQPDEIPRVMRAVAEGNTNETRLFCLPGQLDSLVDKICGPSKSTIISPLFHEELEKFINQVDKQPLDFYRRPSSLSVVQGPPQVVQRGHSLLMPEDALDDQLISAMTVGNETPSMQLEYQNIALTHEPDTVSSCSVELPAEADVSLNYNHRLPPEVDMEHSRSIPPYSSPRVPSFISHHDTSIESVQTNVQSLGQRSDGSGTSKPDQPIGKFNWSNQAPIPIQSYVGLRRLPGTIRPSPPQQQQSVPDSQYSTESGDDRAGDYLEVYDENECTSSQTIDVDLDLSLNLVEYQNEIGFLPYQYGKNGHK